MSLKIYRKISVYPAVKPMLKVTPLIVTFHHHEGDHDRRFWNDCFWLVVYEIHHDHGENLSENALFHFRQETWISNGNGEKGDVESERSIDGDVEVNEIESVNV